MSPADLRQKFEHLFGAAPRLYQAPGRVNLIGEHTDYNDGFVMPAAIDFRTTVAIAPRKDRLLRLHSLNFDESVEFAMPKAPHAPVRTQPLGHWSDYVCGVAVMLERAGHRLTGADLAIHGEVPIGSGLSSSAALEVSAGFALLETSGHVVNRPELARICQRAENEYVGMRSGIMDQFTSSCGRAGSAILLDCRSLDYRLLPLPDASDGNVRLVICNTMIRHRLAGGEYNLRRAECEEAVRLLGPRIPGVRALRDVSLDDLEKHRGSLPERLYRRSRHVVSENARVLLAARMIEHGDLAGFGRLMGESHLSLRDDFEVSCDELDLMVRLAGEVDGVYGARMTGGGFGGCTVNLVRADHVEEFQRAVGGGYRRATGLNPEIYVCGSADGAGRKHE